MCAKYVDLPLTSTTDAQLVVAWITEACQDSDWGPRPTCPSMQPGKYRRDSKHHPCPGCTHWAPCLFPRLIVSEDLKHAPTIKAAVLNIASPNPSIASPNPLRTNAGGTTRRMPATHRAHVASAPKKQRFSVASRIFGCGAFRLAECWHSHHKVLVSQISRESEQLQGQKANTIWF